MRPASTQELLERVVEEGPTPQPSTKVKKAAVEMVARMDTSPR